jgi:superfamily I DNA and RNA helicase
MALEFIPTRVAQLRSPAIDQLITQLRERQDSPIDGGVMYYGWPKYTDYDAVRHHIDLAILSRSLGVVLVRVLLNANIRQVGEAWESISQASAAAVSQLVRSPILRNRTRQLTVPVSPVIFAPGYDGLPIEDMDVVNSQQQLVRFIDELAHQDLSDAEYNETRSIVEGAKALVRVSRRVIDDPTKQIFAAALAKLEDEIASFDQKQRQVALTALGGPHRIRGLAGSGKTVILAMKAALAHLDNPDAKILITYYTRSLRDHLTRLITRFHRHFGDGDPNWKQVHVHHGWGRKDLSGVYREACLRNGVAPIPFATAQLNSAPGQSAFDYACRNLLNTKRVAEFYDLTLIDEGQDFPGGFYELCFALTKGERDQKQIVWAYDELQNIFDVKVRTPIELFGADEDGEPRISLDRSLPPHAETNDFVLPKCYRNQRDVLVLAHAIGFGIYGQPVQMLQDRAHWEDVGYEVHAPDMNPGTTVTISRPDKNSPTHLDSPRGTKLVEVKGFDDYRDEVAYCADEFLRFIDAGLQPEDLMAIAIDDRVAKRYLSVLSDALTERGIPSNNITADRYSEPPFMIEGKCTLSTVYRAKGNEAAMVAVIGCDAVPLQSRLGRNRLFTAFTRTKGWLRITGIGPRFLSLQGEIDKALQLSPSMTFKMPDPKEIELIQRDLSDKDARIQRARAEVERLKESLGLTDDDIKSVIGSRSRNGRA